MSVQGAPPEAQSAFDAWGAEFRSPSVGAVEKQGSEDFASKGYGVHVYGRFGWCMGGFVRMAAVLCAIARGIGEWSSVFLLVVYPSSWPFTAFADWALRPSQQCFSVLCVVELDC